MFVCMGNACRSPMAEAIARRDSADVFDTSSAGLAPLGFVAETTKETLIRNGYSVNELSSKAILREVWEATDIVINMSGRTRELAFQEYSKVEDWDIEDPYGDDPEVYQRTFEKIQRHITELTERLREKNRYSMQPGSRAPKRENA